MGSFESRLRLALAHDRAEYPAAPGMEARVRTVTRRRAAQRRAVTVAGVAAIALVAWLPLRAGLGTPTPHRDGREATGPRSSDRAGTTPGSEDAHELPRSAGATAAPGAGAERVRPRIGSSRDTPAAERSVEEKQSHARPDAPSHPAYPVVKEVKGSARGVDLVPITTPNASAVASVAAVDAGEADALLDVATVLCAVDGPDRLTVGETGSFTATSSGATDAHWANGDPASSPYEHTWDVPGTYEIVLDVTYAGVASMQCHRAVTVEPLPGGDPAVVPEPGPTDDEPDPGAVDDNGQPAEEPVEGTAVGTDPTGDAAALP